MSILRIEHAVPDFDAWKKAFDRDPAGRQQGGVRRYHVLRSVDDPNYVMIDLEFDSKGEAEVFHNKLCDLWRHATVVRNPQARIVEVMESKEY